jgi:hypothetical protein
MFFITLSCLFYFIPPPFLNVLHATSLSSLSTKHSFIHNSSNNLSIHRSFFSFCCHLFSFLALSVISPFFLLSFLITSSTLSKSPLFCHNFLSSCHTSTVIMCIVFPRLLIHEGTETVIWVRKVRKAWAKKTLKTGKHNEKKKKQDKKGPKLTTLGGILCEEWEFWPKR